MAEFLNPAALEQQILAFKQNPSKGWEPGNLTEDAVYSLIARGNDSMVFPLNKSEILKIYLKGMAFLPQLSLYNTVTDRAVKLCKRTPHYLKVGKTKHPVNVNPSGRVYSYPGHDILCTVNNRVHGRILSLRPLKYVEEVNAAELELAAQFNAELGVAGIELTSANIMETNDFLEPVVASQMHITDLCVEIEALKVKN